MMGDTDLYIPTSDMRDYLIAWIAQAQACDSQATTLSYHHEHSAAALLLQERDALIARIMYIQEWADTHTEYPDEQSFKVPREPLVSHLSVYEWWFKYGARNAYELVEVVW